MRTGLSTGCGRGTAKRSPSQYISSPGRKKALFRLCLEIWK